MKDEKKLAEKAELIQALKALFIPVALFLATVTFAAGIFLIYHNEVAGWGFMLTTAVLAVWSFVALFQYQNSYRARGIMPDKEDIMVEFSDELPSSSTRQPEPSKEAIVEESSGEAAVDSKSMVQ